MDTLIILFLIACLIVPIIIYEIVNHFQKGGKEKENIVEEKKDITNEVMGEDSNSSFHPSILIPIGFVLVLVALMIGATQGPTASEKGKIVVYFILGYFGFAIGAAVILTTIFFFIEKITKKRGKEKQAQTC